MYTIDEILGLPSFLGNFIKPLSRELCALNLSIKLKLLTCFWTFAYCTYNMVFFESEKKKLGGISIERNSVSADVTCGIREDVGCIERH